MRPWPPTELYFNNQLRHERKWTRVPSILQLCDPRWKGFDSGGISHDLSFNIGYYLAVGMLLGGQVNPKTWEECARQFFRMSLLANSCPGRAYCFYILDMDDTGNESDTLDFGECWDLQRMIEQNYPNMKLVPVFGLETLSAAVLQIRYEDDPLRETLPPLPARGPRPPSPLPTFRPYRTPTPIPPPVLTHTFSEALVPPATPRTMPVANPQVSPGVMPIANPLVTPQALPVVNQPATPQALPVVNPPATPQALPVVNPPATPQAVSIVTNPPEVLGESLADQMDIQTPSVQPGTANRPNFNPISSPILGAWYKVQREYQQRFRFLEGRTTRDNIQEETRQRDKRRLQKENRRMDEDKAKKDQTWLETQAKLVKQATSHGPRLNFGKM